MSIIDPADHFLGQESTCCCASKAHQKIRQITAGWSNAPPAQAWGASRDDQRNMKFENSSWYKSWKMI